MLLRCLLSKDNSFDSLEICSLISPCSSLRPGGFGSLPARPRCRQRSAREKSCSSFGRLPGQSCHLPGRTGVRCLPSPRTAKEPLVTPKHDGKRFWPGEEREKSRARLPRPTVTSEGRRKLRSAGARRDTLTLRRPAPARSAAASQLREHKRASCHGSRGYPGFP